MSDEQENVGAGSETSGEQAAPAQAETADTTATDTAQADTGAADAGGAADASKESSETSGEQAAPSDASRTGYAEKGQRPGDACVCPDGRTGTVHRFDAGLICLPNQG
jgi:hypothetical protein